LIEIERLTFRYNGTAKPALREVSLTIKNGEFVLVTGPSGGGKSTLGRCLNGLVPHFHGGDITGTVRVQGLSPIERPPQGMAIKVGMVFQDPENQLVAMDVEREIAFGMENLGFERKLIVKRIEEVMDALGIADLRSRPIHDLSGGEKQKVAIAAVLALHPEVLVLDEPTSELDPKSAEEVLTAVQRLNDDLGITVILIEHRLDRVIHMVDRIVIMHEGRVAADGAPRQVMGMGELPALGIGTPPVVTLARKFKEEVIPLTVKEARIAFEPFFHGGTGGHPRRNGHSCAGTEIIRMDRVSYAYVEGRAALRGVSLSIGEGEFVAVMGRKASGKTTLLKHMNGLLKPVKGTVTVAGIDTKRAPVPKLARSVGFVFQNPNDHLFADTVEEEIAFTLRNHGVMGKEASERVDETLERFRLREYRRQYPRSLSGGERERVALASVIVANPKVLLLDEPTRGMDHTLKTELMALLNDYRRRGNTVVLATHDVETAAEYADRVILLSEGRVVMDDSARKVLSGALFFSPQINRLVQSFASRGIPGDILTVDEALAFIT